MPPPSSTGKKTRPRTPERSSSSSPTSFPMDSPPPTPSGTAGGFPISPATAALSIPHAGSRALVCSSSSLPPYPSPPDLLDPPLELTSRRSSPAARSPGARRLRRSSQAPSFPGS
ncbi:hypothetical protein BRADI_4g24023v3 [Brachypodium distachyon]|uniref:Uncharacterized protein n=1 Tax=Brachypodium distachyon TaxID=15368 RepID=A0A2K2CPV3_BRADI|nr:hypothetical protein BRADI_4g24023v3 [Brachypodium distachyon]